ncbi:MAG: hypothetical protein L6263_00710 [Desulfobacteraceae bacterium]|nr:hypothetical protein [Desulfobacteraceae bacterium]
MKKILKENMNFNHLQKQSRLCKKNHELWMVTLLGDGDACKNYSGTYTRI